MFAAVDRERLIGGSCLGGRCPNAGVRRKGESPTFVMAIVPIICDYLIPYYTLSASTTPLHDVRLHHLRERYPGSTCESEICHHYFLWQSYAYEQQPSHLN